MRNVLIVVYGSRGDHEPFIALATAMANSESYSRVHVCVQPDFAHLVPAHANIVSHALPFQMKDILSTYFFEFMKATFFSWFTGASEQERQDTVRAKMLSDLIPPIAPTLLRIAEESKPDFLVATSSTGVAAACVARVLRIPVVLANLQPNIPTPDYPYHMRDAATAVAASAAVAALRIGQQAATDPATVTAILDTYRPRVTLHLPSLPALRAFCAANNVPEMTEEDVAAFLRGELDGTYVLNAYARQLVPESAHWPRTVLQTPSLAAGYAPLGWVGDERCPRLAAYLAAGPPPLCVAFGSMPIRDLCGRTRAILTACRAAGVARVLIVPGAAALGPQHLGWGDAELRDWAGGAVHVATEKVQYSWLLPRCRALMCHGGAGTVGAAVHAGIPLVVSPLGLDQYFWADLVARIGVGAVASPGLLSADAAAFERAVRKALGEEVAQRAAELGRKTREEGDGAKLAAEVLSKVV